MNRCAINNKTDSLSTITKEQGYLPDPIDVMGGLN